MPRVHIAAAARRAGVLAAACGAVLLSGCGVFQSEDPGSDDGGTLTYWSMWQKGEPQSKVLQQAIDEFEREEGVRVDVQWSGREVGKKLRAASNTGRVPDLTDNAVEELLAGSEVGLYRGLGSVYEEAIPGEESTTLADVIPQTYLEPYRTAQGEPVIVPYELTTTSLWFDGAKLPEVAANPPRTWDEFADLLADMKARGETPIAADGTIPDYNAYWLYLLTERHLGPGWLREAALDKTGEAWADPKFLAAAEKVEHLAANDYFMKGYQGSKLPAGQQAWAEGKANFLLMGSWAPADTRAVAREGIEYRSIPMPSVPGGVDTVELNMIGFGITGKARNPELAARFIAFFMNRDRLAKISSEAANLTPREDIPAPKELADLKPMLADAPEVNRYLDGVVAEAEAFHKGVFLPLDDKLFFGDITAKEFVTQLQEEAVDFWKRN